MGRVDLGRADRLGGQAERATDTRRVERRLTPIAAEDKPLTEDQIGEYFDLSEPEPTAAAVAALTAQKALADEEAKLRFERLRDTRRTTEPARRLDHSNTQDLIREVCDETRDFLLEKNLQYGDSAINPVRIFSKANAIEQLLVRIDDKLSRIERGDDRLEKDDDVLDDLIGYFLLLKVAKRKEERS